jgi:hypothetical protein
VTPSPKLQNSVRHKIVFPDTVTLNIGLLRCRLPDHSPKFQDFARHKFAFPNTDSLNIRFLLCCLSGPSPKGWFSARHTHKLAYPETVSLKLGFLLCRRISSLFLPSPFLPSLFLPSLFFLSLFLLSIFLPSLFLISQFLPSLFLPYSSPLLNCGILPDINSALSALQTDVATLLLLHSTFTSFQERMRDQQSWAQGEFLKGQ